MNGNSPVQPGEAFSERVEQVWQVRRAGESQSNDLPATDNGGGEGRTVMEGNASTEARPQAIKQRTLEWMEEGRFLLGLLPELLDENEQLRAKVSALEQELQLLLEVKSGGPQPEQKEIIEVAPEGDLDMASATQMKLEEHQSAGKTRFVVDLGGVEYIDSAGLGELVRAMKRAREGGGDVRLCRLCGPVLRIFEITGLNKAFAVYPTREEAVASFLELAGGTIGPSGPPPRE